MGLQVTASKTALLLECARPFAADTEIEPRGPSVDLPEATRYGIAFHELVGPGGQNAEVVGGRWGIDPDELSRHAIRTLSEVRRWMDGGNLWNAQFKTISQEESTIGRFELGAEPDIVRVRPGTLDRPIHHYIDLNPGEFGGTSDFVVEVEDDVSRHRVVVDYKTGRERRKDYVTPSKNAQMLTLALLHHATGVAIVHTPRSGPTKIFAETVTWTDHLGPHAEALRFAMDRIGDGSLRPGSWCQRCPARLGCPAHDAALVQKTGAMIKAVLGADLSTPIDRGALHMFLADLEKLARRAKDLIKDDVVRGDVITRPDGKILTVKTREYETLSKAGIVRALGKGEGEACIEDLRARGCLQTTLREELWAVDPLKGPT